MKINAYGKAVLHCLQERFHIRYVTCDPDGNMMGFRDKPVYLDYKGTWESMDRTEGTILNAITYENLILDQNLDFEPENVILEIKPTTEPIRIQNL